MKKLFGDKEIIDKVLRLILVALIICVVATPVCGTMFTFLSEDDFSYESGGLEGVAEYGSSFTGSLYKTIHIYKEQQGCYTPMFIDHLIRPYTRAGLPGFHLTLFLYMLLYLSALFGVSYVITKNKTVTLAVLLVGVMSSFTMSVTSIDMDIFYWYTGTVGYSLMISLILFALFFFVLAIRTTGAKHFAYLTVCSILAFLSSGAPLVLTSVNCAFIMAAIILGYQRVKERKYLVVPFVFAMIGALVNAIAPGNFKRSGEYVTPGHETLLDGFRDSFIALFKSYPKAFDVVFILTAISLFALCMLYKVEVLEGGISHIRMIIIAVGVFLIQYFEAFPGAYGNHYDELTEHLLIVHLIITRLTALFVVISAAQWIRENYMSKANTDKVSATFAGVCAAAIALLLLLPASRSIIRDSFTARTCRDFKSGAMVRVYRVREYQLATFEMAEDGTDCIIYTPWDVSSESLPGMGIDSDCEWFVNRSAANLFGLHTTTVLHP